MTAPSSIFEGPWNAGLLAGIWFRPPRPRCPQFLLATVTAPDRVARATCAGRTVDVMEPGRGRNKCAARAATVAMAARADNDTGGDDLTPRRLLLTTVARCGQLLLLLLLDDGRRANLQ